mmetsp:Transcript_13711/g.22360  ORF Transcript_13711/g.22360 Transcript_13711/m.22360 type:complete len:441 (+) Transcript_13711:120-1442(+)|eukprot:CAMPEP_0203795328 /NCGR_PEP_ID=MMETSP0100_2-20121128/7151_1 /ASSEMBLY_ACC=CAM_ASM_000210 /TAXON_ID=96639 /ORGANISM=" , Strain NY0313808BC1" /LENGTH=440 /DNA_ID=CAMNT_0050699789 /DNA_START=307 /DNA_END=1629 /DNA_ORIENTATION=-
MVKLNSLDFYRKIERDLTRGTTTGAILSVGGAVLMFSLFVLEFRAYLETDVSSYVQIDEFEDSMLQVNINLTVERVACPYLSIDLENVLGTHKANLTQTVRKWRVKTKDGLQEKFEEFHQQEHVVEVQSVGSVVEVDKKPLKVSMVNMDSFQRHHKVVLVAFYAPWCKHSQRLLPLWERLVSEVGEEVGIGQTDCSGGPSQTGLCHRNHITAFPTIVTFRQGHHDPYHGDRTMHSLLKHINEQLAFAKDVVYEKEVSAKAQPPVEGCHISGYLFAKKVPGNLIVSAVSPGHSFDMSLVNMTHVVHSLSFGVPLVDGRIPDLLKSSVQRIKDRLYVSTIQNQTHEHYLKVVATVYEYLDWDIVSFYKYTAHSSVYHGNTREPVIKFHYDISPMSVIIRETYKPFYQFLTSMFAIIGGVFTVFGILDGFLYNTANLLNKKLK